MNQFVNDFNDVVKLYYKELKKKKYEPLSKEEEHELMLKAKNNNDKVAKTRIMNANLRFVFDCAKKFKGCGVPLEDLIAEGNMGLSKAFDKFDISYDVKFYSYAGWWIRQAIRECIRLNNLKITKEVPNNDVLNIQYCEKGLEDCENEYVTRGETLLSNEEEETERINDTYNKITISHLLSKLTERERYILSSYFGLEKEPMTLDEIGAQLSISKERVRQVKEKSLMKLRSEALILSL